MIFRELVKEGDVVFDIGAHVGFYTLVSSLLVGEKGRVIAFEPIPENLHYLRQHLEINFVDNVDVIEAAVSDHHGRERLSRGPSSSMWHFGARGELEVETIKLDDLVLNAKLPPPNLIKMDIEGAEELALTGSAELISEFHPVVILSTHGDDVHQRCRSFLESAGYRLSPIGRASIDECRELLAVYDGTT